MIYCDTSSLVSALTEESASIVAVEWLANQPPGTLAISGWSLTEVASALTMKQQRREIDDREAALVEKGWITLQAELLMLDITEQTFIRSTALVDAPPRGLRSGDALHLAVAMEHGCALATFDRNLAEAASSLGVAVHPT